MDKTYNFSDCTVTVHIPEIKNNNLHKASEDFLKRVMRERGEKDER